MSTKIKQNGNWVDVAGGHRQWVGTQAALEAALAAGEIPEGTEVIVTDDYDDGNVIIKEINQVDYPLESGESSNVAAFSPTGWFDTGLKVDASKVAVVFRHQHCIDAGNANVFPMVVYNVSNSTNGNLIFQFLNISDVAKDCTKCRVWYKLIGKAEDLTDVL